VSPAATSFRHESAALLAGTGHALFSGDSVYRYRLTRTWGASGSHALWIMLNPSTADASQDDPTIRRCTRFTRTWRLDGLAVVNLFALRATDPAGLTSHPDPVGYANDHLISEALAGARLVVAAWGAHPLAAARAATVATLAASAGRGLHCLGVTKGGWPRHPLYVPGRQPLRPWYLPGPPPAAEFVAPATEPLTELHRQDPAVPPGAAGEEQAAGATVCGRPMLAAEVWQGTGRHPGDRVCPGCDGQEPAITEEALF
jgi:hypothetical protein